MLLQYPPVTTGIRHILHSHSFYRWTKLSRWHRDDHGSDMFLPAELEQQREGRCIVQDLILTCQKCRPPAPYLTASQPAPTSCKLGEKFTQHNSTQGADNPSSHILTSMYLENLLKPDTRWKQQRQSSMNNDLQVQGIGYGIHRTKNMDGNCGRGQGL